MFKKRLGEIGIRVKEIRGLLEAGKNTDGTDIDVTALDAELRTLAAEKSSIEARQKTLDELGGGGIIVPNPLEQRSASPLDPYGTPEYRSAYFKSLLGRELTDVETRAYSTASGSALPAIPTETANEIIKKMYEVAPILQRCRIYHLPGNVKIPVEGTNSDAALHTENAAISAASDSLTDVNLTGYEITKLVQVSRASSVMTVPAFESYIVDIVGESIARKIENYIFVGTGSSQPGGVAIGGKGASGAYTNNTDMVTVAAATDFAASNVEAAYGMLASGYERDAVWCMSKATFFAYYHPLMQLSTNNILTFANGKYYILGNEVYFTGSLSKGIAYYGDYRYIIGNFAQDITVVKSEHSGLSANSIHYLGACVFDCKPAAGLGSFVKVVKSQS